MKKTNKKKIEEFIRVDHAGERGAIKIYEGQLLALNTIKKNDFLKKLRFKLIWNRKEADKVRTITNIQYHLMPYESASLKLQSLNEVRGGRPCKHQ